MRCFGLAASLLLVSLGAAQLARAQTPSATNTSTSESAAVAPPSATLPLVLSLADAKLDPEAIRRAIELELKQPVAIASTVAGAPSLDVTVNADHTATVVYHAASGVARARSIALPRDEARAPEVIALLAGNLARDEAAELLASLAAKGAAAGSSETANPAEKPAKPAPKPDAQEHPRANPKPGPSAPKPSEDPARDVLLRKPHPLFDLSLVPPLNLLRPSERYVLNGELGLVYSRVGALEGVGFNVMVLNTEQDVRGVSFASFYNRTGGGVSGASAAGLINLGAGVRGGTFAGLVDWQRGDVRWVALAGVANGDRDSFGVSVAGIGNFARDLRGVQLAGAVNRARAVDGVQVSGVTNIAGQVRGAQIGVVNIAGDVNGAQVGVVNVARHVQGASIGLVSVADDGRVQPVIWGSTFMPLNAAVKFTIGSFYTQIGGGYQPSNDTYTYELGGGAHLSARNLFFEPGVHYSEEHDANRAFSDEVSEHVHYRLAVGLDLHAVSPFVGAAIMQRFAHNADAADSRAVGIEGFGGVAFF